MKRVSSSCATEPVPLREHMTHWGQWLSERCLPRRWNTRPGFSEETFNGSLSGKPCLVSNRASLLPDKAAHSFDRWPDSLCNLSQLLAHLSFSHGGSGGFLLGDGSCCTRPASVKLQTGVWGLRHHRSQPPNYLLYQCSFQSVLFQPPGLTVSRSASQTKWITSAQLNRDKVLYHRASHTQMFQMRLTTSLCRMNADV